MTDHFATPGRPIIKPAKALLTCDHQIGDCVQVSAHSRNYHDWRGWTGYVFGIRSRADGDDLDIEVSDEWPPKIITGGFYAHDLERVIPVTITPDEGGGSYGEPCT